MDPLGQVDRIIRERELAVQGIYTWLPEFLVQFQLHCLFVVSHHVVLSHFVVHLCL